MILVTGITGHTGTYFIDELVKNNYKEKIRCIVRNENSKSLNHLKSSGLKYELAVGDLDDVITNCNGWLYAINNFLGTDYKEEDVKSYYIQDLVPKEKWEDYLKFFVTQNTYDHCQINENCVDVIKKLNEKYEIYICSAYVYRDDVMYI